MTRDSEDAYLMGAAEALLFVSDEPVTSARLSTFMDVSLQDAERLLHKLKDEYEADNRGMQLMEIAGGWRFFSHPAYHELIEGYVVSWDTRRMSQAALETLAVIAYHQPVTRASVNAIRGVSSEGVVSSLVEKGLVRELGREKGAGSAILYGTTKAFLEKFGLKSVKDLPPLEDFAPDEATREFIRQRLGASDAASYDDDPDAGDYARPQVVLSIEGDIVAQEVDYGDDEREDDSQAVAALIAESATQKVAFAGDEEIPADASADGAVDGRGDVDEP